MNSDVSVAVASRSFSKHAQLRKALLERYPNTTFNETGKSLQGDALVAFLKGHSRVITALEIINDELLSQLPELEVIGKYGVGLDMIDFKALEKHSVLLGWTGGVNKRSVSELVISASIALLHRVPEAGTEMRAGVFQQVMGKQLTGKTVGIVGCGHIGKDVVRLLQPFNCRVLSHDILEFPDFYRQYNVLPVDLNQLLRESDVVTLHLPLDQSTRNILSKEKLELVKKGAIILNIARGGLIDEAQLKSMLVSGYLGGAALDVFAHEPPDDLELVKLPHVIATPHIGGSTEEAILAMGHAAIDGLDNARPASEYIP